MIDGVPQRGYARELKKQIKMPIIERRGLSVLEIYAILLRCLFQWGICHGRSKNWA